MFAAIGFLAASVVAARRARVVELNPEVVWEVSWRLIIASLVGARLFEVLFYNPFYYWQHPWETLHVSLGGLSVYGGIIGGALAILWYLRSRALPIARWLDVFAFAAPFGIMLGRIGCFLINDHPGTPTTMPWGVRYPDGVIRHDGGLEMAIADGMIFVCFVILARRSYSPLPHGGEGWGEGKITFPPGFFVLLFLGLKGFARFAQDFFRATDLPIIEARYLGLTPAQYVGVLSLLIVVIIIQQWRWQHVRYHRN